MANLRANNLTGTGGRNAIDGSVAFTSSTGYLSTTIDAIGTGDFTIEWWFKARDMSEPGTANRRMFRLGANNATGSMSINYDAVNNDIQWNYDAATILAASTIKIYDNSWYHIAAVREGTGSNETKLYINGVLSDSVTLTTNFSQTALQIGSDSTLSDDFGFYGNISNLRVTKSAVYTAAFTPPTEKYTVLTDTVLLCCQDSDDPTQEATGKTITGHGNLDYSLRDQNLITNGNFDSSATDSWTASLGSGSAALGTGQSGTFGDGNHLVLTGSGGYAQLSQSFTTVVGRTYFVNAQSNGGDASFISTSTSTGDAIITDIRSSPQTGSGVRGQKSFVATATTYYVILRGNDGSAGNFDTVSVYEAETPKAPKVIPPVGVDEGVTFGGDTKINSQGVMYFPTGDTSQRSRGRALIAGGSVPGNSTAIDYFEIVSSANAQDFGDLTVTGQHTACASTTRGVFAMGSTNNTIDYVTITSTSNAVNFGDRTVALNGPGALANNTRGVFLGGGAPNPQSDVMDYITIASEGNATDFGNMSSGNKNACGLASPTRGCIAHGGDPFTNVIDYITIATAGNATDFGDTVQAGEGYAGSASNTRGIWSGGYVQPANQNVIQYITIASTGNAADFGDLDRLTCQSGAGTSNNLRGFTMGGFTPSPSTTATNTIDYITISTLGNSKDFGDLTSARAYIGGASDSHGGLS